MFEILYSNVPVKCKNKTKQNTDTRAKASLDDTMFNTEQDGPGGGVKSGRTSVLSLMTRFLPDCCR